MWSKKYKNCVMCGTSSRRHLGRGLCERCYQRDIEKQHKSALRKNKNASEILTKEFLIAEYQQNYKSLSDLGAYASCSRQYVYKKILEYSIPLRSKTESRVLALEKGKVSFERIDEDGMVKKITLQKNKLNEKFFKEWSVPMAYVLGVIYADGNLRPGILREPDSADTLRVGRLTVSQKEPELLQKILRLMECDAKLLLRKRKAFKTGVAGQIYYFHINNDNLYDDLITLGLSPNKSLKMTFPPVPAQYVRHFIRGCWDGDGSVYMEKRSGAVRASFVSGSRPFIEGMIQHLCNGGLLKPTIYESGNSYYFRYSGRQCLKLYHYLYDDVPEDQFLLRKYLAFRKSI